MNIFGLFLVIVGYFFSSIFPRQRLNVLTYSFPFSKPSFCTTEWKFWTTLTPRTPSRFIKVICHSIFRDLGSFIQTYLSDLLNSKWSGSLWIPVFNLISVLNTTHSCTFIFLFCDLLWLKSLQPSFLFGSYPFFTLVSTSTLFGRHSSQYFRFFYFSKFSVPYKVLQFTGSLHYVLPRWTERLFNKPNM